MRDMDLSMMFGKINKDGLGSFSNGKKSKTALEDSADDFDDIDDVLESISEHGDYSMIPLALNFMHDLTPFDLNSFFESFTSIEDKLFKKHKIDYTPIREAFNKHRRTLQTEYITFIIDYYRQSNSAMAAVVDQYDQASKSFIINRFEVVQALLIEIGRRLSPDYYSEVIASSDDCN